MAPCKPDCEHTERVVTLETEVEGLKEDLKEVLKEVKSISDQLTKYRGFIGGIAFILTGLPILWSFGKDWFLAHWK